LLKKENFKQIDSPCNSMDEKKKNHGELFELSIIKYEMKWNFMELYKSS
jgi:hypothetical protein